MQVSIIVITYNAEKYITECLDSIKAQVYEKFNIIIIDNNSTDSTIDLLKRYLSAKNIFLIKNNENMGFSKACNLGIQHAVQKLKSHFVLLLNQDTVVQENLLSTLIFWYGKYGEAAYSPKILIKKTKSIWWVGTNFYRLKELLINFSLSVSYHIDKEKKDNFFFDKPMELEAITGCALFLPRQIIKDVGIFDEHFFMYAEDIDYSIRLRKKGYKMYIIPNTVVYHDVPLKSEALHVKNNIHKTLKRYYHHFMSSLILLHKHFTLTYMTIWILKSPFAVINEILKRMPFRKSVHS